MQKNQRYASLFIVLTLSSAHTTFGMLPQSGNSTHNNESIPYSLYTQNPAITYYANEICAASLAKTDQGRIFFHVPRYEHYLDNNHTQIPWQSLFLAKTIMLDIILNQTKTRWHNGTEILDNPSAHFKHLQQAIINCEMARELLKRKRVINDPAITTQITPLKRKAIEQYALAYSNNREKLNISLHLVNHRWGDCICRLDNLYPAPLIRRINNAINRNNNNNATNNNN